MNKLIALAALGLCFSNVYAEAPKKDKTTEEGFVFTTVKENPITSIKDQNRSSTCWSFSSLGFLEAELLRLNKGTYDLSEMFVVHHTMVDRAVNYVRYHGDASFSPGGSFYDIMYCMKHYGLVPQEAMPGIMYGDSLPVHTELDAVAEAYVKAIGKGRFSKLTPVWKNGISAIYDTYLGKCPETFTYQGTEYTPKSFAAELGINPDDYVSLTSYTHHPFYTQFALEIQDNWRWATSYNIPIDELMQVFDNAINTGYTIAWGSDVSEKGFTRNGIAVMPDIESMERSGSDQDHWLGLSASEKEAEIKKMLEKPCQEINVTQEMRQEAYDNYETTDDHGMQIYGIAKDQTGKKFYMVKNSWGTDNKYKGTWYASETFVKYKTMNIVVHKDAIPQAIKDKLGIK